LEADRDELFIRPKLTTVDELSKYVKLSEKELETLKCAIEK
jgi:hypothetical protein